MADLPLIPSSDQSLGGAGQAHPQERAPVAVRCECGATFTLSARRERDHRTSRTTPRCRLSFDPSAGQGDPRPAPLVARRVHAGRDTRARHGSLRPVGEPGIERPPPGTLPRESLSPAQTLVPTPASGHRSFGQSRPDPWFCAGALSTLGGGGQTPRPARDTSRLASLLCELADCALVGSLRRCRRGVQGARALPVRGHLRLAGFTNHHEDRWSFSARPKSARRFTSAS